MSAIAAQILADRLAALTREGAGTLRRLARSPAVTEEGEYACALLDGRGRLVAQDQGEPSQLAAPRATVAAMADAFAYNLADGDVLLSGDPYRGGTRGGQMTLARPVFADGDVVAWAAARVATADLAGDMPGWAQPQAQEIWQESLRLTPVKLIRQGARARDLATYLARNTRAPDALAGDLAAAEAALRTLARRVEGLIAAKGAAALGHAMDHAIAYGAGRMRAFLDTLTPGTGEAGADDLRIRIALSRDGAGRLVMNADGTSPQSDGAANLSRAAAVAAILVSLAPRLLDEIGASEVVLDALDLRLPPGSCLDPAEPAAVSSGWRVVAPVLSLAVARALGQPHPVIGPPPAGLVHFPPIGSAAALMPVTLAPGYGVTPGVAGGDGGRRRLVSAEEAEAAGLVRLISREIAGDRLVTEAVLLTAREGVRLPGSPVAPAIVQPGPLDRPRRATLALESGARLTFTDPMRECAA